MNPQRRSPRSDARRLVGRVQQAIERGADTAESIHKQAARLPLVPFEGIDALEGALADVRRIQERSIGALYDLVRSVSQELGRLAARFLVEAEPRPRARRRRAAHKPLAAAEAPEAA
jgi:hypothetical protein